jgi:MFS family permease
MAEQRMSARLTHLARTRGRLPALITAALIAALILAQSIVSSLVGWLTSVLYQRVSFGAAAFDDLVGPQGDQVMQQFVRVTVPFALGVFVSLWLIAPLAGQLGVRFVITRGLLASAAGGVLVFVVSLFIDLLTMARYVFDIQGAAHSLVIAFSTAINVIIFTTPIVILGAVLLWLWLREHPREYEVSGLIDEL